MSEQVGREDRGERPAQRLFRLRERQLALLNETERGTTDLDIFAEAPPANVNRLLRCLEDLGRPHARARQTRVTFRLKKAP
jgi:hypothetical protein